MHSTQSRSRRTIRHITRRTASSSRFCNWTGITFTDFSTSIAHCYLRQSNIIPWISEQRSLWTHFRIGSIFHVTASKCGTGTVPIANGNAEQWRRIRWIASVRFEVHKHIFGQYRRFPESFVSASGIVSSGIRSAQHDQGNVWAMCFFIVSELLHWLINLKAISTSSPWLEKIRVEVKSFEDNRIDVDKLIIQSREADRIRSQMVVLERRVQVT